MSPSEIAFLAFGLVLGAAIGAALVQASGSSLAPRREVRLTITPNAIPARRAHTLAVPYDTAHPGIIPGSPDADARRRGVCHRQRGRAHAGLGRAGWRARSSEHAFSRRPVTLSATAVAVPVAMATAGPGLDGWPVMAALAARRCSPAPGSSGPAETIPSRLR